MRRGWALRATARAQLRRVGVERGAVHGFLDRAGLLDIGDGALEIAFALRAAFDHALPEAARPSSSARAKARMTGSVTFASRKSSPTDFAHQRLAAGIVERVVDQLERDAEIRAVGAQRAAKSGAALAQRGARLRRRRRTVRRSWRRRP